jgi:hypothetical protein
MKRPAFRWTALTIVLIALSLLGPAVTGIYVYAVAGMAAAPKGPSANSCPSPSADFSGKEKKTMATIVKDKAVPEMDRHVPEKIETATFGLG